MKVTIERGILAKAVAQAQSVVERRNTIPILANLLIAAEGDEVSIKATDLDLEVVDRAPARVDQAGSVTVPALMLNEIVRKLGEGALVTLTTQTAPGGQSRLLIEAGRSTFQFATLPAEDFPVMASADYAIRFESTAGTLRRLFDKTRFAISTEETRYYLNGVYLHEAQGEGGPALRAVATDGHRLARVDAPLPVGAAGMPGVIVPRKTVGELRKLLDGDDAAVIGVSLSETKIRFETPAITLTSKVIDGTFPNYAAVIPKDNPRRLEVDAKDFAAAVDRVATISSERSRAVKLHLEEDRVVLTVNAPDSGTAEEEVAAAYADEKMEIGFNAKYLIEIAQQVERENAVFHLKSANDPTIVREGDDDTTLYVVMPMRV